jgi:CDP-diglyceride synthetase
MAKRWLTGLSLGAVGTLWIFSGHGFFTLGFFFTSLIALSEYYTMVEATGVFPAKKTGIVASTACYITAAMFPQAHELVMPLSATFLMLWLLIFNKKSASISEISSSLLGMFYVGFMPSFWVRLRGISVIIPTKFPALMSRFAWANADMWSIGAIMTWWTWFSIVLADVGAYFVGKNFGKHKLAAISAAAGAASPNKTVEGALGGLAACMVSTIVGANLMMWPLWPLTGAAYGLMLAVIALVGDLTASMMKRDAGMKDSGNILPGHGGLLDRIDSYMFTAPAAFFFSRNVLPAAIQISNKM